MHAAGTRQYLLTSGQARRAVHKGYPELSVECPQCHATVGRTCLMKPGFWGLTHTIRKQKYQQEQRTDPPSALGRNATVVGP